MIRWNDKICKITRYLFFFSINTKSGLQARFDDPCVSQNTRKSYVPHFLEEILACIYFVYEQTRMNRRLED